MNIPQHYRFSILIFIVMISTLLLISPVDYEWSIELEKHKSEFTQYMKQSFYEGEEWGGGDFNVTLQILAFLLFLGILVIPKLKKKFRHSLFYYRMRYITFCSLTVSLLLVHGLKNLTARARPAKVIGNDHIYFTHWFEPGAYWFIGFEGVGSFPSGHTASAFFLMAFYYAFKDKIQYSWHKWFVFTVIFSFTGAMAYTRVVMVAHWITDTIASVFLSWICFDLLYHYTLKPHIKSKPIDEL